MRTVGDFPARSHRGHASWSRMTHWIFSLHLHLYPRPFREAFGPEMTEAFALRLDETVARHAKGPGRARAVTLLLLRTGFDALRVAAKEWLGSSVPPPGRGHPPRPTGPNSASKMSICARVNSLRQDTRFAFRTLLKRPLFTLIAVLTLGLGIGSATSVFSVVDAVLLRPLPYADPGTLVSVWDAQRSVPEDEQTELPWDEYPFTWQDFLALRDGVTLTEVAGFVGWGEMPITGEGRPEQLSVGHASANLFDLLGVRPVLGRGFLPGEAGAAPGQGAQVTILSHELWERRFGGDEAILGSTVTLNEIPFTVIGVLPAGFRLQSKIVTVVGGGTDTGLRDLWVPFGQAGLNLANEGNVIEVLGRVVPPVPAARVAAEIEPLLAPFPSARERQVRIIPRQEVVTRGFATPLVVLLCGAGLLLLIACGNVATLLISEAAGRRHEIATRAALGAGRGRLARHLLVESGLLGIMGSVVGIVLALVGTRLLLTLAPPIPRLEEVVISRRVLAFAVGTGVFTGLLFGLAPMAFLSRTSVGELLAKQFRGSSEGGSWVQGGTVAFQLSLTVVLLVVGGLFARSLWELQEVDPGFRPEMLSTLRVSVPQGRYPSQDDATEYFRRIIAEMEAVPGVEAVTGSYGLPFPGGSPRNMMELDGPGSGNGIGARRRTILPNYHEVMGIPLLAGRYLSRTDEAGQPGAMVISESLARRYWEDESPLGATVGFWGRPWTIVGIVGDVRHTTLANQGEPTFYVPFAQAPRRDLNLVTRTAGDPGATIPLLIDAVWSVDPDMPITEVSTLPALVDESTADNRYRTLLILVMGTLATLIASVGVFGTTARTVARKTRELGIRMALGAQERALVLGTLRKSLLLGTAGIGVGLLVAGTASRFLSHLLFGISASDLATYGFVAAILLLVCATAALVPSLRISRMAPADVLRGE